MLRGWDFRVPNSLVVSFAEATIVDLFDGFESHGQSDPGGRPDFALGNFITLQYALPDGRAVFATYAHLGEGFRADLAGPDGDPAAIGRGTVPPAGILASTGLSGLPVGADETTGMLHVHFGTRLFRATDGRTQIRIADGSDDCTSPVEISGRGSHYPLPSFPGTREGHDDPLEPGWFHSAAPLVASNPGDVIGYGTNNDDRFYASENATVFGGLGSDIIYLQAGANMTLDLSQEGLAQRYDGTRTIWLTGIENIYLSSILPGPGGYATGNLTGSEPANLIRAADGNDTIVGLGGNDTLRGFGRADSIDGGAGQDRILTEDGDDSAHGGAGNDCIEDTGGINALAGGDGDDVILGGLGQDWISGDDDSDWLDGGRGGATADDTVLGGDGEDTLVGGRGSDMLSGGAGADAFVFRAASGSRPGAGRRDHIRDLDDSDIIYLHLIDADTATSEDDAFTVTGTAPTGAAGDLWFVAGATATDPGIPSGDTDGDGLADFEIEILTVAGVAFHFGQIAL